MSTNKPQYLLCFGELSVTYTLGGHLFTWQIEETETLSYVLMVTINNQSELRFLETRNKRTAYRLIQALTFEEFFNDKGPDINRIIEKAEMIE